MSSTSLYSNIDAAEKGHTPYGSRVEDLISSTKDEHERTSILPDGNLANVLSFSYLLSLFFRDLIFSSIKSNLLISADEFSLWRMYVGLLEQRKVSGIFITNQHRPGYCHPITRLYRCARADFRLPKLDGLMHSSNTHDLEQPEKK
jgi:hypothetical protein